MNTNRQPKGSPIGGQFAPGGRGESASVGLTSGNGVGMDDALSDLSRPDYDISDLVDDPTFEYAELQLDPETTHAAVEANAVYEGDGVNPELLDGHSEVVAHAIEQRFYGTYVTASSSGFNEGVDQLDVMVNVDADLRDDVRTAVSRLRLDPAFQGYTRATQADGDTSLGNLIRRDLRAWGIDPDEPTPPDVLDPDWGGDDLQAIFARQPQRPAVPTTTLDAETCDPADPTANQDRAIEANDLTLVSEGDDGVHVYSHEWHGYVPIRWPKQYDGQTREQEAERVNGAVRRGMSAHAHTAETALVNGRNAHIHLQGTTDFDVIDKGRPMRGPVEVGYRVVEKPAYVSRAVDDYGHEFYHPITSAEHYAR